MLEDFEFERMRKTTITIKDIARQLGISKSTVSRALSGHSDINEETKKRVLELATRLEYQPNIIAVNLKQQRTNTIGVIIPETVNRFFAKAVGGIQHAANLAGFNVIICQSDESLVTEKKNLQALLASRVDGLLVSVSGETDHFDHFETVINKGMPIVFFDRVIESFAVSQVISNNYDISKEATQHLIKQGCRRIAIIAGPQHLSNSRNRFRGYLDALKEADIPLQERLILHSNFKLVRVGEFARYLATLKEKPDAVFAINDMAALEMMHIFKNMGLKIPDDIAIVGFNNEAICKYVDPPLSSIEHPADELGKMAAELLIGQITKGEATAMRHCINSRLVIRGSSYRQTT